MTANTNTMSGWINDVKHMHIYLRTSTWWAQLNKLGPNQSVELDKLIKVTSGLVLNHDHLFLISGLFLSLSFVPSPQPVMAALPWAWICLCFFLLKRGSSFPLSPSACSHRVVWLLGFYRFTLKYKAHLHDCFCVLTLVHFSFIYISYWDCTRPALYQLATSGAEKWNQPRNTKTCISSNIH